jgi:hypothetical protein
MTSGGRALAVAFVLVGVLGCGGQLPGTDPVPATIDGEGLPLVAALPQASGSCTIGNPPSRVVETARWDAATRTFTMGTLYWKLDERARPVEHGQTDGAWRRLITRDGQGVLTAFTHELQGAPAAENSWDQSNSYDANGRLTGSTLVFRSGARQASYAYLYDDGSRLTNVTSVSQDGDQSVEGWTKFYWSQWGSAYTWRLITREQGSGSLVRSRDTRYYHDSGQLGTIDLIGGELAADVDGYIDMRATWSYDAAGRLVRHEQDAQEPTDPPSLDGVPDSAATFDPACANIAVLPVELYGLESWTRLP